MIRHRVLTDIEAAIDDNQFKAAQTDYAATGKSGVSEAIVQNAVLDRGVQTNRVEHGAVPLRSGVNTRQTTREGDDNEKFILQIPV